MISNDTTGFWQGRRVFVTGHTGFKGAWLTLWLSRLGARVTGYALAPPTQPNLFHQAGIGTEIDSVHGDIRDLSALKAALGNAQPSIVFHLAAVSTVAEGYRDPLGTLATNLTGTANLLDAMRTFDCIEAAVVVTSDKCYLPTRHAETVGEDSPLGGNDPYSASKACADIAVRCWREAYFPASSTTHIASARAGNVIGGGDWSAHRLLPDMMRAFANRNPVTLRMPSAVRPWQHVLDVLKGYLLLAERLAGPEGHLFASAWNFGPGRSSEVTVGEFAQGIALLWGADARCMAGDNFQKETEVLRLDSTRAHTVLGWNPKWKLARAQSESVAWYRAYNSGADMRKFSLAQLEEFLFGQ